MIRNIQLNSQQDYSDPLQLKKEMAAVQIRKSNRQAIFNKRRFPQRQAHHFTYEEHYSSDQEEEIQPSGKIIDKGFQNELKKIMAKQYTSQQLPQLVHWLHSQEIMELYEAVIGIRKLFTCKSPPIGKMLAMKADVVLMELVKHESPQVQMEACWILTNIACGTTEECNTLLRNGIIPIFIMALASDHRQIVEQAVWGLRNMACESSKIRRIIADAEGLQILQILTSKFDDETILDWICSAIATVCRDLPPPTIKTSIHLLCCMLACNCITNKQTLQECLSSISQYCKDQDISQESVDLLLKTNIQVKLVQLIARHKLDVAERDEEDVVFTFTCLEIIQRMINTNIRSVDVFQELNIIEYAEMMVQDTDPRIQMQMVSILADFVMRSEECFRIVLDREGLFAQLLETLMTKDITSEVKLKLFGFFQSIGQNCGTFHVQQLYAETDILQIAVQLLKSEQSSTILQALSHLSSMLIRSEHHDTEQLLCSDFQNKNGVIMLTRLVHHPNKEIQYRSHNILSRFYDTDSLNIFV